MRKNMHYYSIYYLCLAAGLEPEKAYMIAYSSQQVDDAKWGRRTKLVFKDGSAGDFEPVRTAHNGFESMGDLVQWKVYYPFHFLPGLSGSSTEEMAVTRQGKQGKLFSTVLNEAVQSDNWFRIGICLHVLADTYSHDGFSGLWSRCNNIAAISFVPFKKGAFAALINKAKWALARGIFNLAPAVGHGRAGSMPDTTHLNWSYRSYDGKFPLIANKPKFIKGMLELYQELISKIHNGSGPRLSEDEVTRTLRMGISEVTSLRKNIKFWVKQIQAIQGVSVPANHINYNPSEWESEIGKWRKDTLISPWKFRLVVDRDGFKASHFARFHQAALEHRQSILSCLQREWPMVCISDPVEEKQAVLEHIVTSIADTKNRIEFNRKISPSELAA